TRAGMLCPMRMANEASSTQPRLTATGSIRQGQMPPELENHTEVFSKESLPAITGRIVETYEECGAIHHLGHSPLPSYREVVDILADLREILYPGYGRRQNLHMGNVAYHIGDLIDGLHGRLTQQIARALKHDCASDDSARDFEAEAQGRAVGFLQS